MAYEIKTKVNENSVENYINSIENNQKRDDCKEIYELMKDITKEDARMFGDSLVGFGLYSYESKSKCKGEWFYLGFSPRKTGISIYVMSYNNEEINELKQKLGKAKLGACCISIKKLENIDKKILKKILKLGYESSKKEYS